VTVATRTKRRLSQYSIERNDPRAGWTVVTEYTINGRHIGPGSECSIAGERGRFRFVKAVTTQSGAHYLDFIGPYGFRSFYPERVRRVHRIMKTRQNLVDTVKSAA
jgi:hypothetical protein